MSTDTAAFELAGFVPNWPGQQTTGRDRHDRQMLYFYPWVVAVTLRRHRDGSVRVEVNFTHRRGLTNVYQVDLEGNPDLFLEVRQGPVLVTAPERAILRVVAVSNDGTFNEDYWDRARRCLADARNLGPGFDKLVELMATAAAELEPELSPETPEAVRCYACMGVASFYQGMAALFARASQDPRYRDNPPFNQREFYEAWLGWWTDPHSQPQQYRAAADALPHVTERNVEWLHWLLNRTPA